MVAGACGLTPRFASPTRAQQRAPSTEFVPVDHAYGFRNWSTEDQYFEVAPVPTHAAIRERVRTTWVEQARTTLGDDVGQVPASLLDSIADQLRAALVQRAGTNGHCYGMVLTAQRYFERPEMIPVDRRLASEIDDPTVPVDDPSTPVYDEIVRRQADQFLHFQVWLGRRAMLYPDWIDTAAVLRDVRSVVEAFGTAAIMLFNGSQFAHQVLAYGFEDHGDGVVVPIYDPNVPAAGYHEISPRLRFDREDGTLSMQPYGQYTGVLFNRHDRIEGATDRGPVTNLDHLTVDRSTVGESLFPLARIVATTDAVDLAVVTPDDEPLGRLRGAHMDRARGTHARVRTRYGAAPGTYRIGVFGAADTDYDLSATVAGLDSLVVNETIVASIRTGDTHEYELTIPADEGEDGTLVRRRRGLRPAHLAGAGAVGAGIGALGYRAVTGRGDGAE